MDKNKTPISNLTKLSGVPVPIPQIGQTAMQPSIREISMIGETHFMQALGLFEVNAESYIEKTLESISEEEKQEKSFELAVGIPNDLSLFLTIMQEDETGYYLGVILSYFNLIFNNFKKIDMDIQDGKKIMILYFKDDEEIIVDSDKFDEIKYIFQELFKYEDPESSKPEFNPIGRAAEEITRKIEAARAKRAKMNGETDEVVTTVIGTMASNFSLVSGLPLKEVFDMTLPQLIIQSNKTAKLEQRELQNMIGAIHGFKDIDLVDHLKPL